MFGKHLVTTGDVDREEGTNLRRAAGARQNADYQARLKVTSDQAYRECERGHKFLTTVREHLTKESRSTRGRTSGGAGLAGRPNKPRGWPKPRGARIAGAEGDTRREQSGRPGSKRAGRTAGHRQNGSYQGDQEQESGEATKQPSNSARWRRELTRPSKGSRPSEWKGQGSGHKYPRQGQPRPIEASSAESVGEFRVGQVAKCMVQSEFQYPRWYGSRRPL